MKPIRSIGIIMDGNRRYAKEKGLPSFAGHQAGFETLKKLHEDLPRLHDEYGLEYITLYAFSTENWNRSQEEIGFLMQLFQRGISEILKSFSSSTDAARSVRIRVIGERERLPEELQTLIKEVEEKTVEHTLCTVTFAMSYGGRSEILDAVSSCIKDGVKVVTEEEFEKRLWTTGIPDPDLIIRTSGEYRLSNFLPWQGVYSELFFTDTYWPNFSIAELERIFTEFEARDRRKGK